MLRANGFFGHIKNNHTRSLLMFLGFVIASQISIGVLLTLPIIIAGKTNFLFVEPIAYLSTYGPWVLLFTLIAFSVRYWLHIGLLQSSTAFETIDPHDNRRLSRIVDHLAIAAGIPTPKIGLMHLPALNSFACGLSKHNAYVVVTAGLLLELDDDELSAVIAHEIVHIKNGDVGMMAIANASLGGIDFLNMINPFKLRGTKSIIFAVIVPVVLILYLFFGIAAKIATWISSLSRRLIASSREYIADADAVRLTHNPAALISALQKINGRSKIHALSPMADAMMIDGADFGRFASHPPIEDRIETLIALSGSMIHGVGPRRDTREPQKFTLPPGQTYASAIARPLDDKGKPVFGRRPARQTFQPYQPVRAKPDRPQNWFEKFNRDEHGDGEVQDFSSTMLRLGVILLVGFCGFYFLSSSGTTFSLDNIALNFR